MLQVLGALPPDQMEMFYNNPRFKGLKVNDRHHFHFIVFNSQLFNQAVLLLQFPTSIVPQTLGKKYAGVISGIMLSFMQVRLKAYT